MLLFVTILNWFSSTVKTCNGFPGWTSNPKEEWINTTVTVAVFIESKSKNKINRHWVHANNEWQIC